MKKISHYTGDCFTFHQEVVRNKKSETLRAHIDAINDDVQLQFKAYDVGFDHCHLAGLQPLQLNDTQKKELQSLYSYKAKKFKELRRALTVDEHNRPHETCPYCTISPINSFDHFVPQSEFAELSDNPKNLIPACMDCNGHKSIVWREGGRSLFLNLYLDDIPEQQYLFAELNIDGQSVDAKFEVKKPNDIIDKTLFAKIAYHYDKLELCQRFRLHREDVLSLLANEIYSLQNILNDIQIIQVIRSHIENERRNFGFNYWKAILMEAVCNNNAIFDFFKKRPY